ncbi:MAG: hypothetical protein NVS9B2_01920 [Steroidobacteraceae bacterium]
MSGARSAFNSSVKFPIDVTTWTRGAPAEADLGCVSAEKPDVRQVAKIKPALSNRCFMLEILLE